MPYRAPIDEIQFALFHEAGFARLIESGKYPDLTEELAQAITTEAAKLATNVVAPIYKQADEEGVEFDAGGVKVSAAIKSAYEEYQKAGWTALIAPPKYGGQGLPLSLSNAVAEMMNANAAFYLCPMLSASGVEALLAHATDEQQQKYLPQIVSGVWSATMLLTESQAGSDVGNIRTKAIPQGDGSYKLSGTKIYITYGDHDMCDNIIHFVLARTPDAPEGTKGISLFLVPKILVNDDGSLGARNDIHCIGLEKKMGIHASPTCVMAMGENEGAIGWLVGGEFQGMACMFTMMNNARLAVGVQGVGLAEAATQHAFDYANTRKQGRAPDAEKSDNAAVEIINHPDVRRMLMTMRCLTDAARAICYDNAVHADIANSTGDEEAKLRSDLLTPISKAFSTDSANEVASLGVQVHGGMGFIEEAGAAQYMRDARILPIYEGTNGIQAMDLVMRKISLAGGAALKNYIGEMRETAELCRQSNHQILGEIALSLSDALDALDDATDWLHTTLKEKAQDALAGASAYLRLIGLASGGHYLARGALATQQEKDFSPEFCKRKLASAHFFAQHLLCQCKGLTQSVKAGGAVLDDIGLEAFTN
ncbi:MAG: acyl-CoA dehydrogenase [Alphaproteobacteria bacterium]|nr:acyl-CoA dehydrogenase [Alphaproteobacteria bacterium]